MPTTRRRFLCGSGLATLGAAAVAGCDSGSPGDTRPAEAPSIFELNKVTIEGAPTWQAHVTFATARHAAVDLTQVLHADPDAAADRLADGDVEELRR